MLKMARIRVESALFCGIKRVADAAALERALPSPHNSKRCFVRFLAQQVQGLCVSRLKMQLRCWKSITVRDLQDICNFFWSLAKPAQDALLWSMQCREGKSRLDGEGDSSSEQQQYQVHWSFAGTAASNLRWSV